MCPRELKMQPPEIMIIHSCLKTRQIIPEIKRLQMTKRPSAVELRRLDILLHEFHQLNPSHRFAWVDAEPILDIWDGLLSIENLRS